MYRLAAGPALVLVLLALTPSPAACLLATSGVPADPLAPLVAALSLLAWVGAGWLSATTALLVALHGRSGPTARRLRRLAPALLRRSVAAALGATLALGAATPATAGTGAPAPTPVSAAQLDWPTTSTPAPTRPRAAPEPAPVVVAPGDSLWSLTASQLGPQASDRAVAQHWPAWWQANRAVIGEDPDLLRPGTHLVPPPRPS